MLEDEDYVYFFLREQAVEYINCGKVGIISLSYIINYGEKKITFASIQLVYSDSIKGIKSFPLKNFSIILGSVLWEH